MSAPQELDALFTRIFMEPREYLTGCTQIVEATSVMEKSIASFAKNSAAAMEVTTAALGQMNAALSATMGSVATNLKSAETAVAGLAGTQLSAVEGTLKSVAGSLTTLGEAATGASMKSAASNLTKMGEGIGMIGQHIKSLQDTKPIFKELKESVGILGRQLEGVGTAGTKLKSLGTGLSQLGPALDQIKPQQAALSELANSLKTLGDAAVPLEKFKKELKLFASALGGLTAPNEDAVGGISRSMGKLTKVLGDFADAKINVGLIARDITDFSKGLSGLGQTATDIAPLSKSLSQLGNFLMGAEAIKLGKLAQLTPELKVFTEEYGAFAKALARPEITEGSRSLGRLGQLLTATTKFKFDGDQFGKFSSSVTTMFGELVKLPAGGMELTAKMLGGLGGVVRAINGVDASRFAGVAGPLSTLFSGLTSSLTNIPTNSITQMNSLVGGLRRLILSTATGNLNPAALTAAVNAISQTVTTLGSLQGVNLGPLANGLRSIGRASAWLSYSNSANIMANAKAIQSAMGIINAIPVSANATRLGRVMSQLGGAFKNMGGGSAPGGGGGGFFSSMLGGMGGVPPAANSATSSLSGLDSRMKSLNATSTAFSATLFGVRMSILGLSGFGLYNFAQMDEALVRAEEHMRNIGTLEPGAREGFLGAARGIAARSTTSQVDLIKGLDALAISGLSAGASIKGLEIAETFAVASGMKMVDATQKLIDLQNALGLVSEDNIDLHYTSMRKLSDMLVYAASVSGSTESQLAEAFTGRFTTIMGRTKMEAEDALATLTVLSKLSKSFRGTMGGDTAARAIGLITTGAKNNRANWVAKLGEDAVDADGNFNDFLGTLEKLGKTLAAPNSPQLLAEFTTLGLADDLKSVNPIEILIRQAGAIKAMRDELVDAGGAAERMADAVRGSLMGQLKLMWNNVTAIAGVFGERLAPLIHSVVSGITRLTMGFLDLNPAIQNFVVIGGLVLLTYKPALAVLSYGFNLLMTPVRVLIGSMFELTRGVVAFTSSAFSAGVTVLSYLYKPFQMFYEVGALVFGMTSKLTSVFTSLGVAFINVIAGMTNLVVGGVGLLASFASLILLLPVLVPAVAGMAAAIASVGVTVVASSAAIAAGLISLWQGFKSGVSAAYDWTAGRMDALHGQIVGTWNSLKDGAAGLFNAFGEGMTKVAGFLWNFQANFKVVLEWLKVNWRQAFSDIGTFAAAIVEKLASNLGHILQGVGAAGMVGLVAVWDTLSLVANAAFNWIGSQWRFLVHDMGLVMGSFMNALMKNFSLLNEAFGKLADASVAQAMFRGLYFGKGLEEFDAKVAKQKEDAFKLLKGGFTGMEPIPERDFKFDRDLYGLKANLVKAFGELDSTVWPKAGKEMAAAFSKHFKEVSPLGGMFDVFFSSPIWKTLSGALNLTLPESGLGGLAEYFIKMLKPQQEHEEGGAMSSPQGSGFTFKQMSESRFMLGGEQVAALSYQQLNELKQIKGVLQDIQQANGMTYGRRETGITWSER